MAERIIESYCEVKPPEFGGWLRLYHDVNIIKDVYVKQVEINKILEYSRGCVCADIDGSLIVKIHDENGRLMNFVSVSMAQDYIGCLPTTGKRRKLARDLSAFFITMMGAKPIARKTDENYEEINLKTKSQQLFAPVGIFYYFIFSCLTLWSMMCLDASSALTSSTEMPILFIMTMT